MHELSIAQSVIDLAAQHAADQGATRVLRVELRLGSLSGVEPEALRFCFPVAARETPCEGAELEIKIVAAKGGCADCGAECEVSSLLDPCARCGAWPLAVEGGRDMILQSLEVT